MRIRVAFAAAVLTAGLSAAGCSKPVDLKQALQVTDLIGGYHDAGVVGGKNKIVPTLSFRLKKSTSDSLRPRAAPPGRESISVMVVIPSAGRMTGALS